MIDPDLLETALREQLGVRITEEFGPGVRLGEVEQDDDGVFVIQFVGKPDALRRVADWCRERGINLSE